MCQNALLTPRYCCVTEGWQQHMGCPGEEESAEVHVSCNIERTAQLAVVKQASLSSRLTTSGTAPMQDREQEATDRSLELGAVNSPGGKSVRGPPRAAPAFCSTAARSEPQRIALLIRNRLDDRNFEPEYECQLQP